MIECECAGIYDQVKMHKSGLFTMLKGKDGIPGFPEEDLNRAMFRLRQSGKGRELLQEVNENLDTPNHPYNRVNFETLAEIMGMAGVFNKSEALVDYICFGELKFARNSKDPVAAYFKINASSEGLRKRLDAPEYQIEVR